MIARVVRWALGLPALVLAAAVGLAAGGALAFRALDIEAYPNPVAPMVEVIVQPPGWGAEEVERYVTAPLERVLAGMPGLDHLRSQSLFGLADVKCYFGWDTSYEAARQEVLNRLPTAELPPGVRPELSSWNAIGEVYRYFVRGKGYSLEELKTAQDWILEREFRQVPGVVDVSGFGGRVREYHVDVDPNRLRGHGVTLAQLTQALANANQNVGGQRITVGEQSYTVRGIGLVRSPQDVGDAVVAAAKGAPVRVRDVAEVRIGAAPRLGIVGHDGDDDVVQGIVLMRYGGRTKPTLEGIHRRVEQIRRAQVLPPGMEIVPYYDRGALVRLTTRTVMENVGVGIGLVALVLFFFLGSARAALVTAVNVPLALCAAFAGMVVTGTPANLISLGAVDFGIVVESTAIVVEAVFRHLGNEDTGGLRERILAAAAEVGRPLAFATAILAVAFVPLFTMTGVAGVIFAPMAKTYAFAIAAATLLGVTLTPVLLRLGLRPDTQDRENAALRWLARRYQPLFAALLRRPRLTVAAALVLMVAPAALAGLVGTEFMPKLEEGNLWIRATLPTSIALEQSSRLVGRMRGIVGARPEVETVVSQVGRPDDGTDVSGFNNIELFAPLRPSAGWPRGVTKAAITEALARDLGAAFPGATFAFSQMISDNVEEALSGVKGENSVKVVGPEVRANEGVADAVAAAMGGVPGIVDLAVLRSLGQPSVRIVPDRQKLARYGLNTGDVEAVVQVAVGGQVVTQVYEGEKRFDLVVRFLEPHRRDPEALRRIPVAVPDGSTVPLGLVAEIALEDGPAVVYREDGRRYTPLRFAVRGRDLGSAVAEAQARVARAVKLPYGTTLDWAGELNELGEAARRLAVIVPVTLLAIAVLVFLAVRNWVDFALLAFPVLLSATGGFLALLATGQNLSVSAIMGFVSLFGVAVLTGLLIVGGAQERWAEGEGLEAGARLAGEERFRPVLMTTIVATLGLLPAALSDGIGAQAQKPLATVVIGGSLALAFVTRALLPPLVVIAHRRFPAGRRARGRARPA